MTLDSDRQYIGIVPIGLLTFALVFGWFFLLHDVGFDFGDEGYLWNNALLTFEKGVPIRDFRSYDPGRYYWEAMWFFLLGPNLFAHRFSIVVVQFIGFFAGLLALRRVVTRFWILIPSGILLFLYMYLRVKVYEESLVLVALLIATRLVEEPNRSRHFVSGVVVGIAAFWAKNFGLYFGASFFFLILFLSWGNARKTLWPRMGVWMLGILVGYSPMIFMCLSVPGFWQSFVDANLRLFDNTAPVKPLPIPWPWHNSFSGNTGNFLLGTAYVLMYSYYLIALLAVVRLRTRCSPLFIAATFIGIPILHNASVRADFSHLAISISPFLLVLIVGYPGSDESRLKTPVRCASFFILTLLSWLLLVSSHEIKLGWQSMKMRINLPSTLVSYQVRGQNIYIKGQESIFLKKVQQCFVPPLTAVDKIFIAPYSPGLYFFLQKKSPIWDAFPIHTASLAEQKKEIAQLEVEEMAWVLVSNEPLDGIPERRFSLTHPLVWQHIQEHFVPVNCPVLGQGQQLLHARR